MLRAWTRQRVDRLYRTWAGSRPHARPTGWLFNTLSTTWRTSRSLYRRWVRARQPLLLSLDEPARLTGCGSITGWVLSRESEVVTVEAWVNKQLIAQTVPNHQRRDAHAAYPFYPMRQAGFRLCPRAGILPDGMHPLRIIARDALGNTTDYVTNLHIDRFTITDDSDMSPELFGSDREYQYWLKQHDQHLLGMPLDGPLYTIIVLGTTESNQAIVSVQQQTYSNYELLTCATEPGAVNTLLQHTQGEFVLMLNSTDRLHPQALQALAAAHQTAPADVYYTDEDVINEQGHRCQPFFKTDWSNDLLHSMVRMGNGMALRRSLMMQAGLPACLQPGLEAWELAMHVTDQPGCRIIHVPGVFLHTPKMEEHNDPSRTQRCLDILESSLERQGKRYHVEPGRMSDTFRIRPSVNTPKVSILIPTKDQPRLLKRCLTSIRERTDYPDYEIIVLDNGSQKHATLRYLAACPADHVLTIAEPFNHSRLNNLGAAQSSGEFLVLLNDDTEVLDRDWLSALVEEAHRDGVGAVGATLQYPDGQTQHAGIILDAEEIAFNINSDMLHDGVDRGLSSVVREVSAVTGACLLLRRQLFLEAGGLDEALLPTSYNDVDFCLRLRRQGWRIVQTPYARLIHHEAATRQAKQGIVTYRRIMQERWQAELQSEQFWNRHLGQLSDWNRGLVLHHA